ncbi:sporulation protein [Peribacillus deserti]|uniref:Sporulation protein n=1 Tax=Peribacillus deserti TaxID=673318 RepID=A0A2N5M8T8_9BACI|nr:sporulation protein [Peribacillus deserti]PLT30769.1 sporulation protein [Peribacillus deserti]
MLLRKYMSLIGVGSAKIDLILQKDTFKPGDAVHGYFLIKGGTIEQQIKRIDCDLVMTDKAADAENVIDSATILTTQLIKAEETNKISFTFKLPDSVPISSKEVSYRFKTKLTFDEGVESRDLDRIQIIE